MSFDLCVAERYHDDQTLASCAIASPPLPPPSSIPMWGTFLMTGSLEEGSSSRPNRGCHDLKSRCAFSRTFACVR